MEVTQTINPSDDAVVENRPALPRGATLDRYVVLQPLGAGGMGVVYSAFDPELDRRVALKVVHPQRLTARSGRRTQRRLAREAQALAKLNHPNVLAVHDVGVVGGQLYVATELVDGADLSKWLDGATRRRQEIIAVFLQAGAGLAAAHAAGLVHRDFKLSNVMVDREGRVRVVDFGLASRDPALDGDEVLAAPLDEDDETTVEQEDPDATVTAAPDFMSQAAGGFMGTPAYAAPEQLAGQPVTAAADQFSFCVSLCRALTGEAPFSNLALRLPTQASAWEPDAKGLGRLPAALRRLIRRGLSFDPAARFPSMEALLTELETIHGRGRRQRRRAAFVAVAAGAAALVAFALTWRQQQMCTGGAERFASVWNDGARTAVEKAFRASGLSYAEASWLGVEAILDRYGERWSAMHESACRATAVEGVQSTELLDRRMACLDARLYEVGALVDTLRLDEDAAEFGVTAAGELGSLAECADTRALLAPTPPPKDPEQARRIEDLRRRLAEAEAAVTAGDALLGLEKAELLAEEAQAVAYWPVIAESLLLKARFESSLERSELADTSLAQALEAAQAAGHARVAASAFVYRVRVAGYQQADFDRGQRYAQYAEAALSHLGQPQELAALLAGHRGAIFFEQGRFPEALEAHVDALELWTEARGPEDPKTGVALTRVGDVLLETGDLKAAAARYEAALEIARRQYGETHPQSARLFSRTGRVLMKQGESTRARGFFEQALAASRATLPPDHPYLATSLSYLAQALVAAGDYEEAMDNYRQALAVLEAAEKPDPRRLSAVLSGLARTSSSTNDYAQAARFYGRALELRKEVYGDGHVLVGEAVFNLGEVAQNQGDFERALSFFRQSLDIWRRAAPDDGFLIAAALTGVAEALLGLGDSAAALPRLEQALGLHPQGREAEFVATTQFALARALVAEGRESVRARELAEGALEGFRGGRALSGEDAREVEQWLETHFAGR